MKLEDIAQLMGMKMEEVEEILRENEVIELNLTEKRSRSIRDYGKIELIH